MKMNFLSGVKPKSILGRKLSNRYLSRDAFTSTNRFGRSKIRRLGSVFKTKRSLFELKFTVMKVLFLCLLLVLVAYTIPTFRYMIHRSLSKSVQSEYTGADSSDTLGQDELYIAPKYLATDVFVFDTDSTVAIAGAGISDAFSGNPVGIIDVIDGAMLIKLFSDPGFKNNFFIRNSKQLPVSTSSLDLVQSVENASTSTATSTGATSTSSSVGTGKSNKLGSVIFEGSGYGEIIAKLPPQQYEVRVGDVVYMQTVKGPKPVAHISRIAEDSSTGSTFTTIYAQLLTSPQSLYKVKVFGK